MKIGKCGLRFYSCFGKCILLLLLMNSSGCGYRVRSSVGKLPGEGHSIGIPTFRNLTTQYKIEQQISRAVIREFSVRTRSVVNSDSTGVDLILLGEIRNVSASPVTFGTPSENSQTTGSSFIITVQLSVKLMRLSDSSILWSDEDLLYREPYAMNSSFKDFFSEENPALERLAKNFASSLASTILNQGRP